MPWATSWHGTSTATICFKWVKKQHHPSRLSSLHCLHPLSLCPPFFFGLPGRCRGCPGPSLVSNQQSGSEFGFEVLTLSFSCRVSALATNETKKTRLGWILWFAIISSKSSQWSILWHQKLCDVVILWISCHHKPVAELKMPLVFAPHLVFDGSVGHHTSWIPRIKSYESHDHDEWVNPIPNPELIQKHPTEVFGLTFTILKKVLDILRSYVVLLCRMCPLCCSTWTMEWCLAHFWDLEKAAMAHSWKVKKCDSAGTGTKKIQQKND